MKKKRFSVFFKLIIFKTLFIFRKREMEGDREGEKHRCDQRNIDHLSLVHTRLGTEPAPQTWVLTRDRTCSLSPCGTMPNQHSHTSQGSFHTFDEKIKCRGIFVLTGVAQLGAVQQSEKLLSDSWSRHGPGCRFGPWLGCVLEAPDQYCSPSLSPSLLPSLKINK